MNVTGKLITLDSGHDFTFDFATSGLAAGHNDFVVMTAAKGYGDLTGSDFRFTSTDINLTEGTFEIIGNDLWFKDGYGDSGAAADSGGGAPADFGSGPQPVPEPSTWAMLVLGGAVLIFARRRALAPAVRA